MKRYVLFFISIVCMISLWGTGIYEREETLNDRILSTRLYVEGLVDTIYPNQIDTIKFYIDSSYIYLHGSITYVTGSDIQITAYYVSPDYDTYRYTDEGDSIFLPANTPLAIFVKNGVVPRTKKIDLSSYGLMYVNNDIGYHIDTYIQNISLTDTAIVYMNFIWRK